MLFQVTYIYGRNSQKFVDILYIVNPYARIFMNTQTI